jgi:NAD(P)-dependent dehydrogenase (short-subunit alcohol dehydrogenase family)
VKLHTKLAVVTGAGKGIGQAIAQLFAEAGAIVILATKEKQEGIDAEKKLKEAGHEAYFYQTDVEQEQSIVKLFQWVKQTYGFVDVLVNNAGITLFKSIDRTTIEDWNSVMNIDLRGTYLCSKYAVPLMHNRSGASIINISSNHAVQTLPDAELYAAAKGGVNAMTRSMALSLGEKGIRVNAICPGFTDTPHYQKWLAESQNPMTDSTVRALHATNQVAVPNDIAELALFLGTEGSRQITGECIQVDGGLSVRLY